MATIALFLSVFLQLFPSAQASLTPAQYRAGVPLDQVIPAEVRDRIDQKKELRSKGLLVQSTPDFSGLPTSVDLRHRDRAVTDQGSKPWCTIYGLVSAMENILGNGTDLSERDGWDNQRGIQNVNASQYWNSRYGIVAERFWPMGESASQDYCQGQRLKPTGIQYVEDDIEAAVRHIASGKPVYVGMATPNSMYACDTEIDPKAGTTGGGHAITFVGYRLDPAFEGGGAFLVKNSWGTDCGDRGYQWYPFGTCARRGHYCVMYKIGGVEEAPPAPWCSNGNGSGHGSGNG